MKKIDANLSVFISNPHVGASGLSGGYYTPGHTRHYFLRTIDEILKMDPLPGHLVIFGDLALWAGRTEDYEISRPMIDRLKTAGIGVAITMGNHDHRKPFLKIYPEYVETSPVPEHVVSTVDLGMCDLILLDTKWECRSEGFVDNEVGILQKLQQDWLVEAVKSAKRPFMVGGHHRPGGLRVGRERLWNFLCAQPQFIGYVNGDDHHWDVLWHMRGGSRRLCHEVSLPSTGAWGDIGYALCRTSADRAVVSLVEKDFFYPHPLCEGDGRPAEWNTILKRNQGQFCTFFYPEISK